MFHEGKEFGNLFHLDQTTDFNINATQGYLRFHTNTIDRMRLTPTLVGQVVNGYPGLNLSGHLGIGASPTLVPPLTYLHIDRNGTFFSGYRPWMPTGTYMSEYSDGMYVGTKNGGPDRIDAVINWSDNKEALPPYGPDALRFIFTRTPDLTSVASTLDGLEIGRLIPATNGNEGYFGIGDFFTPGLQPTERLDVLNGRVRIRKLPDDPEVDQPYRVMVVDNSPVPSGERGVVKWIDPSNFTGITSCSSGWSLQGNNAVTAYNGNPCIPQAPDRVGIGTTSPLGKIHIETDSPTAASLVFGIYNHVNVGNSLVEGIRSIAEAPGAALNCGIHTYANYGVQGEGILAEVTGTSDTWGVKATVSGGSNVNTALYGMASGGDYAFGATATSLNAIIENIGFTGVASNGQHSIGVLANATNATTFNYGILASGSGPMTATNYAGYFAGDVYTTGAYLPSDEMLKTNVANLQGALGTILSLAPKTYEYLTSDYPRMNLPVGQQAGVMAQDLAIVLPGLVKTTIHPAEIDSVGNPIDEPVTFSAVNLTGLIPYLIGAVQEQQATIAQLQDQINNCCTAQGGMAPQGGLGHKMAPQENDLQEQRLLIIPNPVADLTTLEYYVPKAGKVSLQVSTSDGKPLATLREELAEAGAYNYSWNTTKLAAGTYFCTFMLDGAVVVKRAVKVK